MKSFIYLFTLRSDLDEFETFLSDSLKILVLIPVDSVITLKRSTEVLRLTRIVFSKLLDEKLG